MLLLSLRMLNGFFNKFGAYFGFFLMVHFVSHAFANEPTSPASQTSVDSLTWDGGRKTVIRESSGVRMFWWNIHEGAEDIGGPKRDFQSNLGALIHSGGAAGGL